MRYYKFQITDHLAGDEVVGFAAIYLFEDHDVIIAKCQCFESRYSEADVWNPIIAKPTCLGSYNSKFLRVSS